MKRLNILGSTGSIGTQALKVAGHLNYPVVSICANSNIELLENQIREFKPKYAVCIDIDKAKILRKNVKDTKTVILEGRDGLLESVRINDYDLLINGIVGMAGTVPTLEAVKNKKNVAVANKESIVTAGEIIMETARLNGVEVIPVDSEHSAIFQCLGAKRKSEVGVHKLILTASGGSFFGKTKEELKYVTAAQALKHPNWSMGRKITVDCSTLMNKGLEIIEAARLFDMPEDKIETIIHRESIIHSLVEFNDGALLAQLGVPDMCVPIQFAVTYPERMDSLTERLDLAKIGKLTFYKPDEDTFISLKLCRQALRQGGIYPTVLNSANEVAVEKFLNGEIGFYDIFGYVQRVMDKFACISNPQIEDILYVDQKVRQYR